MTPRPNLLLKTTSIVVIYGVTSASVPKMTVRLRLLEDQRQPKLSQAKRGFSPGSRIVEHNVRSRVSKKHPRTHHEHIVMFFLHLRAVESFHEIVLDPVHVRVVTANAHRQSVPLAVPGQNLRQWRLIELVEKQLATKQKRQHFRPACCHG